MWEPQTFAHISWSWGGYRGWADIRLADGGTILQEHTLVVLVSQALSFYFSTKLQVSRWVQGPASTPSSRKAAENVCRHQGDPAQLCFSHSPSRTLQLEEGTWVGEGATEPGAHLSARQAEGDLILGSRAGM